MFGGLTCHSILVLLDIKLVTAAGLHCLQWSIAGSAVPHRKQSAIGDPNKYSGSRYVAAYSPVMLYSCRNCCWLLAGGASKACTLCIIIRDIQQHSSRLCFCGRLFCMVKEAVRCMPTYIMHFDMQAPHYRWRGNCVIAIIT